MTEAVKTNIWVTDLSGRFWMDNRGIWSKDAEAIEAWRNSTLPRVASEIVVFAICVPFVRQRLRRQDVPIISLSAAIVSFVAVGDKYGGKKDDMGQGREQCEVCVPLKTFRPSYQFGKCTSGV